MNDKTRDPFDAVLELPDDRIPTKRLILGPERRRLGQFTQFPNTWAWRLRKARSTATWRLACHLLWQHWLRKRQGASEQELVVSTAACRTLGISQSGKVRALRELEALGLVRVTRRDYKNPTVVLLFPEPGREEPDLTAPGSHR